MLCSEEIFIKTEPGLEDEYECDSIAEDETIVVSPTVYSKIQKLPTAPLVEEDTPFRCSLCSYAGTHSAYLKTHMKIHTSILFHSCKFCPFVTPIRKYLKIHEAEHPTGKYQCDKCGCRRPTKAELKDHVQSSHLKLRKYSSSKKKNGPPPPPAKKPIRRHLDPGKRYPCTLCKDQFKESFELKQHLATCHNNGKSCRCPECPFTARKSRDLNIHRAKIHGFKKSLACETGPLKSEIQQHAMVTHSNLCSDQFEQSFDDQHLATDRLDELVKPYRCNDCPFTAQNNRSLNIHRAKIHTVKKKFACKWCSFKCDSESNLQHHVKEAHTRSQGRLVRCEHCRASFRQEADYLDHVRMKHPDVLGNVPVKSEIE